MAERSAALIARARTHLGAGRIAAAEADLAAVLAQDPKGPNAAEAHALLGTAALARGDFVAAERRLRDALARAPKAAWAHSNLGLALQAQGRLADAVAAFRAALAADPKFADGAFNLGAALEETGAREDAIGAYRQALAADPNHAEALNNLALKEAEDGRREEALALYRRALAAMPGDPGVLCNLGNVLAQLGRTGEAEQAFRSALAPAPSSARTLSNYGAFLHRQGRLAEALDALRKAANDPTAPPAAAYNLGLALESAGRTEDALAAYARAAERDPQLIAARINQIEALRRLGRLTDARAAVETARAAAPEDGHILAAAISLALHTCDWRAVAEIAPRLDAATRAALGTEALGESPSLAMRWRDDPEMQLRIGRTRCDAIARQFPPLPPAPPRPADARDRRIVLGYMTHDARAHAGGYMVSRMFDIHDRARFEVRVYATCADDGSDVRRAIAETCDAFIDARALSHVETAARIRADGVDILVDLNGWSEGGRLEVAALRPAPVQATYVGFPATTGATFFDYAIVDAVIAPDGHEKFFAETLARLPHSYQINDGPQLPTPLSPAERAAARRDAGLPETAVVFASFNQTFKIEPVGFDAWMRILAAVPGSALWLRDDNPLASDALRREAQARGIDPGRLIFAPRRPRPAHLARLALADCALDPRVCNGHTTTTDALAVGLPVIAGVGRTFAGRVSASLLGAAGLSDLVTTDPADYEALAIRLGRDPAALDALKARVRDNAGRWPLLDSARTVRNLERLYEAMWRSHAAGKRPAPIQIDDPAPPRP